MRAKPRAIARRPGGRSWLVQRVRPMTSLVLGPLLRYVDATTATIWVETADGDRGRPSSPAATEPARGPSPCTATTTRSSS